MIRTFVAAMLALMLAACASVPQQAAAPHPEARLYAADADAMADVDAALAGDWDQVEALQTQLDTFGAIVQKGRSLAQSLAALKAACAAQGLCTRDVLPPLVPLDAAAFATLRQDCAVLGLV